MQCVIVVFPGCAHLLFKSYSYTDSVHSYVEAVTCAFYAALNSDNHKDKLILVLKEYDVVSFFF